MPFSSKTRSQEKNTVGVYLRGHGAIQLQDWFFKAELLVLRKSVLICVHHWSSKICRDAKKELRAEVHGIPETFRGLISGDQENKKTGAG
jgi:hypothetical protein